MNYIVIAFAAEPMAVRVLRTLLGMLAAKGRQAQGMIITTTDPQKAAEIVHVNLKDKLKESCVISVNYPREHFGYIMDLAKKFVIWREQTQMDWEKLDELASNFNARGDYAFGYTIGLQAFNQAHVLRSNYAVPVIDILPSTGWCEPFSRHRRSTVAMVSNRGGRTPFDGESEWSKAERRHRNEIAELLRKTYGPKFLLAGDGWDKLGGIGMMSLQGTAGIYTEATYGIHASHAYDWHHRLAEILLCGAMPVVRTGTGGCVEVKRDMKDFTEFSKRYIKGCYASLCALLDVLETPGTPMLRVDLPPTPCVFYTDKTDLEDLEQFSEEEWTGAFRA